MPFKHEVTDSKGKVHRRVSQNRSYAFAVIKHFADHISQYDGRLWPAHSPCSWASRLDLAQKEARKYQIGDCGFEGAEIIPCTPVATGKQAGRP